MRPTHPGPATTDLQANHLEAACAHLDAATQQLTAAAGTDPFSPAQFLAAHVSLLQAGIHPGIRAEPDPNDTLGPLGHLDRALELLDAIPRAAAPADLMVWTARLAELRPTLAALAEADGSHGSGAPPRGPA